MNALTPSSRDPTSCRWFALRVRSAFSFVVRDQLRSLGIVEYLPTLTTETRWSDRLSLTTRPVFPGYIFARFDADSAAKIEVLRMRGVCGILSIDGAPAAIPDAQIEGLRRVCETPAAVACCPYVAGETVTVARGPFAGVSGVVTRTKGAATLTLNVEGLRHAVRVEIDVADLDPPKKEQSL